MSADSSQTKVLLAEDEESFIDALVVAWPGRASTSPWPGTATRP